MVAMAEAYPTTIAGDDKVRKREGLYRGNIIDRGGCRPNLYLCQIGVSQCDAGVLKKDMGRGTNQTFKVFQENTGKFSPQPTDATPLPGSVVYGKVGYCVFTVLYGGGGGGISSTLYIIP